jgi:5-methylcytosine-specific restriction endonuclease McrA
MKRNPQESQFMSRTRSIYRHMLDRVTACDFSLEDLRQRVRAMLDNSPLCRYCKKTMDLGTWSLDHVIPLSRGGSPNYENTQLICSSCNKAKGNLTGPEFQILLDKLEEAEVLTKNFTIKGMIVIALATASSFRFGRQRKERQGG